MRRSDLGKSIDGQKKNKSAVHSRDNKKTRRMRKSSLSKAQKNFQVFNDVDNHVNKYENLTVDSSESEILDKKHHISDDILIIDEEDNDDGYDDYDGHYDSPRDVPTVLISSDGEIESSNEPVPRLGSVDGNALAANDDFIALSNSSEEEQTMAEKENDEGIQEAQMETNKMSNPHLRTLNSDYPWILNHDHSRQKEIADWLTMEIKDFVGYISPNKNEIETRNRTISKIRQAIKQLWPDADLNVFGSYATDLYLPGSDIDCVVISKNSDKENRNSLYSLASHLKKKKLASRVEVIAKARVPIIKFVEPESQIHIDVSFERTNGIEAARLIREWLDDTPGLRELVLIVKQFLHSRRLNNVHTGGLGGFSIICLVFAFLHLHPRIITNEVDPMDNLGVLLIDFFELYGKNFAYDDVSISVSDGKPTYIPKSDWKDLNTRGTFTLAIQDPGDPSNNISRGSFNLRDIKKSFAGAFYLLTNRCFELDMATFKDRLGKSILGDVIKYRGKARDFNDERNLVINKAIEENERYHKKRSRIVHEEVFIDPSGDEAVDQAIDEEEDMYHIEEPPTKKRKRDKQKEKGKHKKRSKTASPTPNVVIDNNGSSDSKRESSKAPPKDDNPKNSVESLMGLPTDDEDDDDGDGYNPLEAEEKTTTKTNNDTNDDDDQDGESSLKKYTVDAQTRRDYWLGKSNAMSSNST
ncbi:hypothetical protein HG535_0F02270 [Zygotorulaspora mrakii]|uniref:polynucleotide adenylyltransferase n=1 Tax=Zygotorulaspora mrakii TaxID=42260 RepID=A0A7H9B5Z1_ZYGMR|nr:uncharacterized protein HG535_0F02270 [Zygotorulaspora mrakii]QLG73716.1 hypothetical protein HG535_0F02270 [Zygotorulaspora mrakii]